VTPHGPGDSRDHDGRGRDRGGRLRGVDPGFVARFGEYGAQAADELRAGKVVLPSTKLAAGQTITLQFQGPSETGSTGRAVEGASPGTAPDIEFLRNSSLITPEAARKLGTLSVSEVQFELTRQPTDAKRTAVTRLLGRDDVLQLEEGYQSPAHLFLIGILAAAQAWVLGQLGCVLGVGVGALYGYTAHAAFGSPHFMVPWTELAGIVIVVPLFAGLLAWLMTRSRVPMVSRID